MENDWTEITLLPYGHVKVCCHKCNSTTGFRLYGGKNNDYSDLVFECRACKRMFKRLEAVR